MAAIELTAYEIELTAGDTKAMHDDEGGTICIKSMLHATAGKAAFPELFIKVSAASSSDGATIRLTGYEQVDLLRRYCEMTLELFQAGRLEE